MAVRIQGLNKVTLLRAMWMASKPAIFYEVNHLPPPAFDEAEAAHAVAAVHIDYFCGRAIKCGLRGDVVQASRFDTYVGVGALQNVVDVMRATRGAEAARDAEDTDDGDVPKASGKAMH